MKTLKKIIEERNERVTRIQIIKKDNGEIEYIPQYADTLNYKIECVPVLCFGVLFFTIFVATGLCVKCSIEVPFFVFLLSFFSPLIFTVISYKLDLNWIYHDIWKRKSDPINIREAKSLIELYLLNINIRKMTEEATLVEEKQNKIKNKTHVNYP